jgi:hypothetical protein
MIVTLAPCLQTWRTYSPTAVEDIESFENRGDFLAVFARAKNPADQGTRVMISRNKIF